MSLHRPYNENCCKHYGVLEKMFIVANDDIDTDNGWQIDVIYHELVNPAIPFHSYHSQQFKLT